MWSKSKKRAGPTVSRLICSEKFYQKISHLMWREECIITPDMPEEEKPKVHPFAKFK